MRCLGPGQNGLHFKPFNSNSYSTFCLFTVYSHANSVCGHLSIICAWSLTVVLLMWSCRESMSRSPTGCQQPLTSSGRLRCTSSWSIALCRSWSFSRERSTCSCQPPTCPSSLSQRSRTSAACFRIALATRWAFSSGDNSERRRWGEVHVLSLFPVAVLVHGNISHRKPSKTKSVSRKNWDCRTWNGSS